MASPLRSACLEARRREREDVKPADVVGVNIESLVGLPDRSSTRRVRGARSLCGVGPAGIEPTTYWV